MKHQLKVIKPYGLINMIVVVEDKYIVMPEKGSSSCLWYLYSFSGDLVKKGYGNRSTGITANQQAFNNAGQAARRFIRKDNPLIFWALERGKHEHVAQRRS